MIDFVKVGLVENDLNCNKYLDFKCPVSKKTGVLDTKSIAEYKGLKFIVYDSGVTILKGSLHKFYNNVHGFHALNQRTEVDKNKGYNGNRFTYSQFVWVLNHLAEVFGIDLIESKIMNIEFGVNLIQDKNPESILSNLIQHFSKPFSKSGDWSYQCKHSQYRLKVYDKGQQYQMKDYTLRIELHYNKMERINKAGISSLAELLNKENLARLKDELLMRWGQALLYDHTIRENELNKRQKEQVLKFNNPNFWNYSVLPHRMDRFKKQYMKIVYDYSDQIHDKIENQIISEWDYLMKETV